MTVEDQRVAHDGMGEAFGRWLGVFYNDDVMVGPRDDEWLHHQMNILFRLFLWYGLTANVAKSCTMRFQPGALRSGMSADKKTMK